MGAKITYIFAVLSVCQDLFLMRMKPIFSTSRSQSDAKKPDDDWQEQFFKLDVKYIVCQQVSRPFTPVFTTCSLVIGIISVSVMHSFN